MVSHLTDCLSCLQDAGEKAKAAIAAEMKLSNIMQIKDGRFVDDRWKDGRWDFSYFKAADGTVDWDKVSTDGDLCVQLGSALP